MEPLSAFVMIVGLLSDFLAHRKSDQAATEQEFFEYLSTSHQDQLVQLIKENSGIAVGTKALLNETREDLTTRLDALTKAFAEFASGTREFAPLVSALVPDVGLSDQALSILRTMSASGASNFILVHRGFDGGKDLVMDARADFKVEEQRFLDSDLDDLVRLNLLRLSFGKNGSRMYYYTRRAEALVQSLG